MKRAELSLNGKTLTEIAVADSYFLRLRGLIGRDVQKLGGLWLKPCNQIHMFFMKYPIDVIYLSKEQKIIKIERNAATGRIYRAVKGSRSVLELPSGSAVIFGMNEGNILKIKNVYKIQKM